MLSISLNSTTPIAWLTSDRLLEETITKPTGFKNSLNNFDSLPRAVFDYQSIIGTNLRNEDVIAAISHWQSAIACHKTAGNKHSHQQSLQQLGQHFLYWQGQCFEVQPKLLQEWLSLASVMDLSWIIAKAYTHAIHKNHLSVQEAITAMLDFQCPVALPKSKSFEEYADNHVHLGGHGHTNISMLDIALHYDPKNENENRLKNWPRRSEYKLFESGKLDKTQLPKLVYKIGNRLAEEVLADNEDNIENIVLGNLDQREIKGLEAFLEQPNIDGKATRQLLFHALHSSGSSVNRWLLFCCGLMLHEQQKTQQTDFNCQLLALIRASNVLRNYMITSAVGLGQFVEYFGFKKRKAKNKSANLNTKQTGLNYDLGPNTFREFRSSPDELITPITDNSSVYQLNIMEFEQLLGQLDFKNNINNIQFVMHFVRDFSSNAKKGDMLWRKFRTDLINQVNKLQDFHASVTFSDRPFPNSSLEDEKQGFDVRKLVRGYDVAGNENELPIEVFAPALRVLRTGKQTTSGAFGTRLPNPFLTVHAGEDFSHILSGLRAIDEAVVFCGYQSGDRLGHALALGLDVQHWAQRQQTIYLTVRQHFDNLVWCHYQALHLAEHLTQFTNITSLLEQKIHYWANYLGLNRFSINDFYQGWKLRRNCPRALEFSNESTPTIWQDWIPDLGFINSEIGKNAKSVWNQYLKPTEIFPEDKSHDIVAISCQPGAESYLAGYSQPLQDSISAGELQLFEAIQDYLVEKYSAKGIIIEACPTSNIYIGRFQEYHEHPIFRWHPPNLKWLETGEKFNRFGLRKGAVNVCINTDDSALMPTTIANEHRVIRDVAVEHYQVGSQIADDWIRRIREYGVQVFKSNNLPQ